jgi:hypothetical protein
MPHDCPKCEHNEQRAAQAEFERDEYRKANESVAVCAAHVDLITQGDELHGRCWVCQVEHWADEAERPEVKRDEARAEAARGRELLDRARDFIPFDTEIKFYKEITTFLSSPSAGQDALEGAEDEGSKYGAP